ncbi:polysaccharide export protein [Phlyctema vagabunda]|uniref:Polysaccharide export protein n=1 Tax=Phlyctema vagabunda TaxID=108571 RepID=A0ABR4PCJ2_9HELO
MLFVSRSLRRRYSRPLILGVICVFLLDAFYSIVSQPSETRETSNPVLGQKIFIASIFRNNEYILRLHWINALLDTIKVLGPENIYVSIVESGSQDDTKGALRDLQHLLEDLGVEHKIELGETVEEQGASLLAVPEEGKREGWIYSGRIEKSESGWEVRRIPYLARLRNKAMEPLSSGKLEKEGKKFRKVMWINDVIFTKDDVTTLLSTRNGQYAAACSLDFSHGQDYYDTFALRDQEGHKTASLKYPYFHSPSSRSRLFQNKPIPAQSCWNGMVIFDSSPFYAQFAQGEGWKIKDGLKFRGVDDSLAREHVEGSECCLIHADNPLTVKSGVWINPNVRVAYNEPSYALVNPGAQFEETGVAFARRLFWEDDQRGSWPSQTSLLFGTWQNRWLRLIQRPRLWSEREVIERRVKKWAEKVPGREEKGTHCLINEMQVLFQNGWQHVE